METRTQCIIYVRTSTKKQRLDHQENLCVKYANENNFDIKAIHRDFGLSGSTMDKRDGLKNALESIQSGDIFIVRDYARLARNTIDSDYIINTINNKGGKLVVLDNKPNINTIISYPDLKPQYVGDCVILINQNDEQTMNKHKAKCITYSNKNGYKIKRIIIETDSNNHSILERKGLQKVFKYINKENDILIIPNLLSLTDDEKQLSELSQNKQYKKFTIAFVTEDLRTSLSGYLVLKFMLVHRSEIMRASMIGNDTDHVLNIYNLCELLNMNISRPDEKSISNDEINDMLKDHPVGNHMSKKQKKIDGYIYLIENNSYTYISGVSTNISNIVNSYNDKSKRVFIFEVESDINSIYNEFQKWLINNSIIDTLNKPLPHSRRDKIVEYLLQHTSLKYSNKTISEL